MAANFWKTSERQLLFVLFLILLAVLDIPTLEFVENFPSQFYDNLVMTANDSVYHPPVLLVYLTKCT
jgi:hypothetical protein